MFVWQWQKCWFEILDFVGCFCWVGVDLVLKLDVVVVVLLFEKGDSFYVILCFYVFEFVVEENEKYQQFLLDELIVVMLGNMIDYVFIEEELKEFVVQGIDVQDIVFDLVQVVYLMICLEQESLLVVEMVQFVCNLLELMKEVEVLILLCCLWYDGNVVMIWMMGNVVVRVDVKEYVYLCKEKMENKIDGVVVLIMVMGCVMQVWDIGII